MKLDINCGPKSDAFKCKLILGDSKDVLKGLPNNSIHMSVTSPPYWDQRDYKIVGQLGQENTPEEYVEKLVEICKEVKRVLREDGTFWLNIGDGYCKKTIKSSNLKQQDLIGVPWAVAFALRKDGWYLRNDVIWEKINPMPESQTTRLSKSHEHLFLFSKSSKYFFDAQSIAVEQKEISIKRAFSKNKVEKRKDYQDDNYAISGSSQDKTYQKLQKEILSLGPNEYITRNKRDVWTLATASSKAKHFAAFPNELVEPCILAGSSSRGCCPKCQTPWIRKGKSDEWEAGCNCGVLETKESIVLDPFNGSGTTGRVCKGFSRKYVGIEISEEYLEDSRESLVGNEQDIFGEESKTIEEFIDL